MFYDLLQDLRIVIQKMVLQFVIQKIVYVTRNTISIDSCNKFLKSEKSVLQQY